MKTAFVLLNCEKERVERVRKQLESLDQVQEVQQTFGVYDVIAKLKLSSEEGIKSLVSRKIRNIDSVRSALTLIHTD